MQTTRLNKLFLLKRSLVLSVSADPTNRCLFVFLANFAKPSVFGGHALVCAKGFRLY